METSESKQVVARFWELTNGNEFSAVGQILHAAYVLERPQSGYVGETTLQP